MSRVTDVRSVAYGVPDLAAERKFYCDVWRLRVSHEADGMVYLAAEGWDEPYAVRLRAAPEKRVDVIALAADTRTDVDVLHRRVEAAGCRIIFEPKALAGPFGGYGFRFFNKDGLPFEISSDIARGVARPLARWEGIPERISHVVLHSPDHKGLAAFFVEVLGFRISDWLGDFMVFLRCNQWHHRIAILPGPPCVDHVAYDMLSVDDMMRGISRLKGQGFEIQWGPGRHTAGDNTFSYFVTPNGFVAEYTAELEEIGFDGREAIVHTPSSQVMDQWGVGVGGPQAMPHPEPDAGLFQAVEA